MALSIIDRLQAALASFEQMRKRVERMEMQVAELVERSAFVAGGGNATSARELVDAIAQAKGEIANSLNGTENVISGHVLNVLGRLGSATTQLETLIQQVAGFEQRISAAHGALANDLNALLNSVSSHPHLLQSVTTRLDMMVASATSQGGMANEVNAIMNTVLPQTQVLQSLMARVETLAASASAAREQDAVLFQLSSRSTSAQFRRWQSQAEKQVAAVLPPTVPPTLEQQMTRFGKSSPQNFPAWQKAYIAGVEEGRRSQEGNLSHEGHIGAGYFRMFINVHARGRLLDVGCGPIAMPSYLADYPVKSLAGVDPQLPIEPHPFPFAQTFAETLPWPDASFETIVIATSLDHVFLLDEALAEVKRLLTPKGRLLLWTAIFDATPRYDALGPQIVPPDGFHLFHPGRNWFYGLFENDYRLIERIPSVASAELIAYELKA